MSKYDAVFKRKVVAAYLSGCRGGFKSVGHRYGLDDGTVRKWVRTFELYGSSGFLKKFTHYDVDFKLGVLRRMRKEELSFRETAALFDLRGGASVVSRWVHQYDLGGAKALESKPKGRRPMKKRAIQKAKRPAPSTYKNLSREELLLELEYVSAERDLLKKLDALMKEEQEAEAQKLLHEDKS